MAQKATIFKADLQIADMDRNYYGTSPNTDPQGPSNGFGRALRGGSWNDLAHSCRITIRQGIGIGTTGEKIGFRCVRR